MKKSYKIDVDCANCAAKIETALNRLEGVEKATVSFLTQKLVVEAEDPDALLPQIEKTGKRVDADFAVLKK